MSRRVNEITYPERPISTGVANQFSVVCRLLSEISWEGNVVKYHDGGIGFENVLSAEVFQALDFLPRSMFLGSILRAAVGQQVVLDTIASRAEDLRFRFLPGSFYLGYGGGPRRKPLWVQPDGIFESDDVFCLVEAKRIRSSSFQREQLAREYITTIREAKGKQALMLLVLAEEPPLSVSGHGKLAVRDAIENFLPEVLPRVDCELPPLDSLVAQIDSVVAHVTWKQIAAIIHQGIAVFGEGHPSVAGSVSRLASSALNAIEGHA